MSSGAGDPLCPGPSPPDTVASRGPHVTDGERGSESPGRLRAQRLQQEALLPSPRLGALIELLCCLESPLSLPGERRGKCVSDSPECPQTSPCSGHRERVRRTLGQHLGCLSCCVFPLRVLCSEPRNNTRCLARLWGRSRAGLSGSSCSPWCRPEAARGAQPGMGRSGGSQTESLTCLAP